MRTGAFERAETAYALTRDLVRVDTTNPPGRESAAADLLQAFLAERGVACVRAAKAEGRDNLVARQAPGGGGILLAGHLDVVGPNPAGFEGNPAEGWELPPFAGAEKGGYLYGRGSADMKGMVAMSAVLFAHASKLKLRAPLSFAAVADEETGCVYGSKFLVEERPELVRAQYMLGEGGGFTQYAAGIKFCPIGTAEKGQMSLRARFRGKAGHGSLPHPENAAFRAARGLSRLAPGSLPVHVSRPARLFFQGLGQAAGPAGLAFKALCRSATARAALRLLPGDMASSLRSLLSHTVSPTRFFGSPSVNVIPDCVTVDMDVRTLPGFGQDQVLGELRSLLGSEVELEVLSWASAVESESRTPLFSALASAVRRHDPECVPVPFLIPGYTDAKHFSRAGMRCYGFSPLLLSKEDAADFRFRLHGRNERVSKEAFLKGYALLEDAVLGFLERAA